MQQFFVCTTGQIINSTKVKVSKRCTFLLFRDLPPLTCAYMIYYTAPTHCIWHARMTASYIGVLLDTKSLKQVRYGKQQVAVKQVSTKWQIKYSASRQYPDMIVRGVIWYKASFTIDKVRTTFFFFWLNGNRKKVILDMASIRCSYRLYVSTTTATKNEIGTLNFL